MSFVDIVFPLNLRPLTYKCPKGLEGQVKEGMIASAPLRNKLATGVIISQDAAPPSGPVKEFATLCCDKPVLGRNLLKLLSWMSDYYLASAGSVLQQTMPKELFSRVKSRTKADASAGGAMEISDVPAEEIAPLLSSAAGKKYRAFLVHAPAVFYEYSVVSALLRSSLKNVLVIFPEVSAADAFFRWAGGLLGERVCLLHGGMSRGLRSEAIGGIVSGKCDVVVGTRAALFAPMKTVSLIAVLHEHSASYKLEEGIRYNIRDVAVMRGFIERAPVVLSSVTPSVDSYFNALTGKYILLSPPRLTKRPRITIVDMRYAKKVRPGISKEVADAAKGKIRSGKRIMFVINRRGYSTLLLCADCGHRETCDNCEIPLVMHKDEKVLKCHYCGMVRNVPDRCGRCGSVHLELLGAGTQKMQEEIEGLFGIETVRFDSDEAKKRTGVRAILQRLSEDPSRAIIGTKMMTRRIGATGEFSMAAVMNTDVSLSFPDFRASEKAYRELSAIAGLVEPGGEVLVQTRFPGAGLFKCLRSGDYASFMREEISARKELSYPPYAKLINVTVTGNNGLATPLTREVKSLYGEIEVLGPTFSRSKKREEQFSVLLKSAGRKALHQAARTVLDRYGKMKGVKIVIDVDPA
jgi:primosomal protein N' (replication factor Y)